MVNAGGLTLLTLYYYPFDSMYEFLLSFIHWHGQDIVIHLLKKFFISE